MKTVISYIETVRNEYCLKIDEEQFEKDFPNKLISQVLEENFNNNIWLMQDELDYVSVEFNGVLDFIDTDFDSVDIDE